MCLKFSGFQRIQVSLLLTKHQIYRGHQCPAGLASLTSYHRLSPLGVPVSQVAMQRQLERDQVKVIRAQKVIVDRSQWL